MSEITPERVAAHLGYFSGSPDKALGLVIVNRSGARLDIRITRDGSTSLFRAVVVEGETDPIVLDRDRYRDRVEDIVKAFSTALASSVLEMYPYHLARLKGALWDLAEAAQAEKGGKP
ncbi:hypothetical protein DMB42_11805 [Nonomuraea sp. WAC 01424]|uniref:hypothetical protein n=1 Tax=Nonomuraea sp. WAC 01424 TaxID=2203200 RepID=UPI000F79EEA2|nr:hypothetical protein [Nonomuraea sp. WAC 01424]RSN12855.1 hypothetical protein DMB42_11805 [Nonomuraea sp. WAC 01424]